MNIALVAFIVPTWMKTRKEQYPCQKKSKLWRGNGCAGDSHRTAGSRLSAAFTRMNDTVKYFKGCAATAQFSGVKAGECSRLCAGEPQSLTGPMTMRAVAAPSIGWYSPPTEKIRHIRRVLHTQLARAYLYLSSPYTDSFLFTSFLPSLLLPWV